MQVSAKAAKGIAIVDTINDIDKTIINSCRSFIKSTPHQLVIRLYDVVLRGIPPLPLDGGGGPRGLKPLSSAT